MKLENIEYSTIIYICAMDAEGVDAESISRRLRTEEIHEKRTKVNVHDVGMVTSIFNNWRKRANP